MALTSRSPCTIVNRILAKYCAELCAKGFGTEDVLYALRNGAKEYAKIVADDTEGKSKASRLMDLLGNMQVKTYKGGIEDLPDMLADIEREIRGAAEEDGPPKDDCMCPRCVARRAREAGGASHQGEPRDDV